MSIPLRIHLISLLNAVAMLLFTFYWLNLPYTFGDEAFLIKWSSLVKKSLFGIDPKPDPEEVLFVDVSGIKTTIDGVNEFGEVSPYHRRVITDRAHLTEFFALLNEYREDIRLVFCDILFIDPTTHDPALQAQFDLLGDKLLGVSHLLEDRVLKPVFDLPHALATYQSTDELFLKYPLLLGDSLKTVPLALHERLDGGRLDDRGIFFPRLDGRLSLPDPIIDFKVRKTDFRTGTDPGTANFTAFQIGTLLESRMFMSAEDLRAYFQGKLVIVGDFETDVHETPFGELPGPILVYNAYLTLKEGDNKVSVWWMLFLLLAFYFLSSRVFAEVEVRKPGWLADLFQSRTGKIILNALDEFAILTLITLLSYFLFQIHINILILLVFVKTTEFIWRKRRFPLWKAKEVRKDLVS